MEDGTILCDEGFGAKLTAFGEAVFNISMAGYQEILTDPSYKGQVVAMMYPQIGNYGSNAANLRAGDHTLPGFSCASSRLYRRIGFSKKRCRNI